MGIVGTHLVTSSPRITVPPEMTMNSYNQIYVKPEARNQVAGGLGLTGEQGRGVLVVGEAHVVQLDGSLVKHPPSRQTQRQLLVLVQVRQLSLFLLPCA